MFSGSLDIIPCVCVTGIKLCQTTTTTTTTVVYILKSPRQHPQDKTGIISIDVLMKYERLLLTLAIRHIYKEETYYYF